MIKMMLGFIQMATAVKSENGDDTTFKDIMTLSSAQSKEQARTALYSFLEKKLYDTVTKEIGGTIKIIL